MLCWQDRKKTDKLEVGWADSFKIGWCDLVFVKVVVNRVKRSTKQSQMLLVADEERQ